VGLHNPTPLRFPLVLSGLDCCFQVFFLSFFLLFKFGNVVPNSFQDFGKINPGMGKQHNYRSIVLISGCLTNGDFRPPL